MTDDQSSTTFTGARAAAGLDHPEKVGLQRSSIRLIDQVPPESQRAPRWRFDVQAESKTLVITWTSSAAGLLTVPNKI
jgi:hypothetical protein